MTENSEQSDVWQAWLREQLEGLHRVARNHEQLLGSTALLAITQESRLAWVLAETIYVNYRQICIDVKLAALIAAFMRVPGVQEQLDAVRRAETQINNAYSELIRRLGQTGVQSAWQEVSEFRNQCMRIMLASGIWREENRAS